MEGTNLQRLLAARWWNFLQTVPRCRCEKSRQAESGRQDLAVGDREGARERAGPKVVQRQGGGGRAGMRWAPGGLWSESGRRAHYLGR